MMTQVPTFDRDDEAELLGMMAAQGVNKARADAAWVELRERHVEYLYRCVRNAYGVAFNHNEDDLQKIVEDAFLNAFRWAAKQPSVESASCNFRSESPDGSRRRFRAWLGRIATNLANDALRRAPAAMENLDQHHDVASAPDVDVSHSELTPLIEAMRDIFLTLSEKDQEALKVCLEFYNADTQQFALPPGVAATIAESLGMNVDQMRKRRQRAIAYIRARLIAAGWLPDTREETS